MPTLSATDVANLVRERVNDNWRTAYQLCIEKTVREKDRWVLKGTVSKPTRMKPIPKSIAHVVFRVNDSDAAVQFRLEQQLSWRNIDLFNEVFIDRVLENKLQVSLRHPDIVEDDFGSTREQLNFDRERQEEEKIAREKKTVYYSDESEDEYFGDEVVFKGDLPQYEVDLEDIIRNKHIHIREVVEEVFEDTLQKRIVEIDYFLCLAALEEVSNQLVLDEEDLTILHSDVQENNSNQVNLEKLIPNVVKKLQRRLTHKKRESLRDEWIEEFIVIHSPGLERCIEDILERFSTHIDNQDSMPRTAVRETLARDGEGLFEQEINSVMALLERCEEDPTRVVIDETKLAEQIRRVRLAFARDSYLQFESVQDIESHIWNLLGPFCPSHRGHGDVEEKQYIDQTTDFEGKQEEEGKHSIAGGESQVKLTRAQIYHGLLSDRKGLVLSKELALSYLATCPNISEADDVVSGNDFAYRCAKAVYENIHPAGLSRSTVLLDRCEENISHVLRSLSRDEFNAELWHILEIQFPERSISAMSSNSFTDCITTFLGESISTTLIDSLASCNINLDFPSEVNCKPLLRHGYDYILILSRTLALLDERSKEDSLNDQLIKFKREYGLLQIQSIDPVKSDGGDDVRITTFCSDLNITAEAEYSSADLAELLGLENAKSFLSDEVDPGIISLLQEFMFLDSKHKIVIHVPLNETII